MANREDVVIRKNQFSLSLHTSLDAAARYTKCTVSEFVQKP